MPNLRVNLHWYAVIYLSGYVQNYRQYLCNRNAVFREPYWQSFLNRYPDGAICGQTSAAKTFRNLQLFVRPFSLHTAECILMFH